MSKQYRELVDLLERVGVMQDDSPWSLEVQALVKKHRRAKPAAQPQGEPDDYPACDYCGVVPSYHPWHGSGLINGLENRHIHACDDCRGKLPAHPGQPPAAVVLPERMPTGNNVEGEHNRLSPGVREGWNACLDAVARLNKQ